MHDRTGTVTGHRAGYPIVTFDNPEVCCNDPRCGAKPEASSELIRRFDLPVGTRVQTFWESGETYGGLVAVKIEEERD